MQIIAKIQFGSHLYGTNIPNLSDDDFRVIYLPSVKDCLLLKVKDSWEDKSEEDTLFFSLQHFLKMAVQGQSIAIELLSATPTKWAESSLIWQNLHNNRKLFYTKNMHSFCGFARTMSAKYSTRTDRLQEVEDIMKVFNNHTHNLDNKLYTIWDELPELKNAKKSINDRNNNKEKRVYIVCGREIQSTVTIGHAGTVIDSIRQTYGQKVINAKEGKIEWKSLAHAFRAIFQVREIIETKDLTFPSKHADWLKDLRLGKLNYIDNKLDEKLNNLLEETQILIDKSDLPLKVDNNFINNIILEAYNYNKLIEINNN